MIPGSDQLGGFARVQHAWAVTKYHRSTANLDAVEVQFLPEDIRPMPILTHTLSWLWQYLDDTKVFSFFFCLDSFFFFVVDQR
jgi:hypothetical protein